jgi:ATP-dependent Lon protease
MAITTRSKEKKKSDSDIPVSTIEESVPKKSSRSKKKNNCVILKIEKQSSKEDMSNGSDDEDSEEDMDEEEFELPESVLQSPLLTRRAQKIISYIQKKTVRLDQILTSDIRIKNRAELFELFYVYENTMPNSEERMEMRKILMKMFEEYQKEHHKYLQHKKEIRHFERQEKRSSSILDIQYEILRLNTSKSNKEVIYYKYLELKEKTDHDDEYFKLKKWIRYALDLPFDTIKSYPHLRDTAELTRLLQGMKKMLDDELFGMKKVKEQILLFIHNKLMFPEMRGCCLGLVGPPGVGKTTIARCIAKLLDFPFQQISFGGVHNTEFLKGFDYTYVGSQPGEIVRCLMRMKYKNGILFFDEYEKISKNNDIVSFLLHLTDFSQNHEFRDNYLSDIVIDLSCMWFLYSMNELPTDKALQDRIFTVQIEGYSRAEKIRILIDFLFPRHLRTQNLGVHDLILDEDTAGHIILISCSEKEKGIRNLERAVKDIIHKISFMVAHQDKIPMSFKWQTPLVYPVTLTRDLIDVLLKDFKEKDHHTNLSMYL